MVFLQHLPWGCILVAVEGGTEVCSLQPCHPSFPVGFVAVVLAGLVVLVAGPAVEPAEPAAVLLAVPAAAAAAGFEHLESSCHQAVVFGGFP